MIDYLPYAIALSLLLALFFACVGIAQHRARRHLAQDLLDWLDRQETLSGIIKYDRDRDLLRAVATRIRSTVRLKETSK